MSSFNNQNELNPDQENRRFDQLDHRYGRGKWILNIDLEALALEYYRRNGRGITFPIIVKEFGCSKDKAQRKLKNACKEKIDKNGKKDSLLFTLDNERTKPQQYYPSCIRAEIIENKRNRPINPTGVNHHSSHSFEGMDHQPARYFLEILHQFLFVPVFIHKLFIQTFIPPSYYNELNHIEEKVKGNNSIQYEEIIGPLSSKRRIIFTINPNGTVMIYITCSRSPFKLGNGEDISYIFSFLGQIRSILLDHLKDPNERILPPLMDWKLKQCDINKDVEIKDVEQITLPDIQLIEVDRVFRLYVKALEQRAYYRLEESKKVNQNLSIAFDNLLKTYNPFNEFDDKNPIYIQ